MARIIIWTKKKWKNKFYNEIKVSIWIFLRGTRIEIEINLDRSFNNIREFLLCLKEN